MKTCKQCEIIKPISDFYNLHHTKDGLNYRCISCQNQYNKDHARKIAVSKLPSLLIDSFPSIPKEFIVRFIRKIHILDSGCWLWKGSTHPVSGYGRFWISASVDRLSHRLSYQWSGKEIPDGLVMDHKCRNRWCVNPIHLEPVTNVENIMRGESIWAKNARKTHCHRGHEFTDENTYTTKKNARQCKECLRIRKREFRSLHKIPNGSPIGLEVG